MSAISMKRTAGRSRMGERKYVLFAFNGDPMCFVHVVLTALDMKEREFDVKVVIEGSATRLVKDLAREGAPAAKQYADLRDAGLIECVCKACSNKTGALEAAEEQGLPLCSELSGHPGMARFIEDGYTVITF